MCCIWTLMIIAQMSLSMQWFKSEIILLVLRANSEVQCNYDQNIQTRATFPHFVLLLIRSHLDCYLEEHHIFCDNGLWSMLSCHTKSTVCLKGKDKFETIKN